MFRKKKYTEEDMQEAVNCATAMGYQIGLSKGKQFGYFAGLKEVSGAIEANTYGSEHPNCRCILPDAHAEALGLIKNVIPPETSNVVKEAQRIYEQKDLRGEGVND